MLHYKAYNPPCQKQINVRVLLRIKDTALVEVIDKFRIYQGCVDVDMMVETNEKF